MPGLPSFWHSLPVKVTSLIVAILSLGLGVLLVLNLNQQSYETLDGARVLSFFQPLKNERDCQECHGKDHNVRGVLRISLSLEQLERELLETRRRHLLDVGAGGRLRNPRQKNTGLSPVPRGVQPEPVRRKVEGIGDRRVGQFRRSAAGLSGCP